MIAQSVALIAVLGAVEAANMFGLAVLREILGLPAATFAALPELDNE